MTIDWNAYQAQANTVRTALAAIAPETDVETIRSQFLSKKQGSWTQLTKMLPELSPELRKKVGQDLQALRQEIEARIAQAGSASSTKRWLDPTLPGYDQPVGSLHPVTHAIDEISQIFTNIGFTRVRYPEVDWDWYAFEALNMPKNHPARDDWETFFVNSPISERFGKTVLTPHTSNGQVREMERMGSQPPIRMINIARTYRRQQDATHTQMFHQFEALVVDTNITIQHLKGTIDHFAQQFYGPGAKSRLRPFHFQFTEPSFEIDFYCPHDTIENLTQEQSKFFKSGWHEVGGAGMVHPNVLRAGGIDPDKYTGFAFGWGVERTYALKPGMNLYDIRAIYGNDLRFLKQF